LFTELITGLGRNFWAEVKKIKANKSGRCRIADGKSSEDSVADVFLQNYKILFTSVPYDKSTIMQAFVQNNRNLVLDRGFGEDDVVTTCEVRRVVSKLKAGKIDSSFELSSDHFVHAGDDLFWHIALLLSAMIVHGRVLNSLLVVL